MSQSSINMNPFIYLTNPISIANSSVNVDNDNDWKFHWYDYAHHHSLLVKELNLKNDNNEIGYEFYILCHDNMSNKIPILLIGQVYLQSNLIYSKISLEMKLISVQISLSSIIVIDIEKMKRWIIDIKASSDNVILEEGIIWSTHGGNSEDLVIVTTKGIELYKISPSRGQCKLSRYISRRSFKFWYNPKNRLILLASRKTIKSSAYLYTKKSKSIVNHHLDTNNNIINDTLVIDGYILNSERTTLPILELPPPEHIPAIAIGPGVISSVQDIFQITLYGIPYMLVRNIENDSDYISVYALNKRQIELVYTLALNLTNIINLDVSVCDNLILCHCASLLLLVEEKETNKDKTSKRTSLIFDILSPPTTISTTASTTVTSSSSMKQVIFPLLDPSSVLIECGVSIVEPPPPRISRETTPTTTPLLIGISDEYQMQQFARINSASEINHMLSNSSNTYFEWEPVAFDKVLVNHQVTKHSHNNRKISTDSNHSSINNFESLSFLDVKEDRSDLMNQNQTTYMDRNTNGGIIQDIPSIIKFKTINHITSTSTTPSLTHKYLSPNKYLDNANQCIWDMNCNLAEMIKSCKLSAKEIILFLQRRGRQYEEINQNLSKETINEEIYVDSNSNMEARVAKQLLLSRLYNSLCDKQDDIQELSDIFLTIMIPYINKSKQQEIRSKLNSTDLSTNKILFEDPLEPINSLQIFTADITILSNAINEHITNTNVNKTNDLHTYHFIHRIQLSTMRDSYGNIICTQSEILSHIWLPLILDNLDHIKYYTKYLTLFILSLNESLVTVMPAYGILLINLLFQSQQYEELISILQFHYLPESTELALTILELSDILQCTSSSSTCAIDPPQIQGIELLSQAGLDILWKLGEKLTGQLWLLPGCISGLEFFISGIAAVTLLYNSYLSNYTTTTTTTSSDHLLAIIDNDQYTGRATGILHSVYMFIKQWEGSILSTSLNKGKSRLSMQVKFPDHLFNSNTSAHLRFLFGFT